MAEGKTKKFGSSDVGTWSEKNDDSGVLASIRNLGKTAETVGAERFRDQVIPDLKDHLDDEDDILLAIAEELGKEEFDGYVGGPTYAHVLLPPLEILAKAEETFVREKAVASLTTIAKRIPENLFEQHFVDLVHRLAESEFFSPKSSACLLFSVAYGRASAARKAKLLAEFKICCKDGTPMVRRNAATALKKLAPLVEKENFSQIIENFKILAEDDQDSVRLLAVENCVTLAEKLTEEEKNTIVKPVILACGSDRSWRVRYMVASTFTNVVDALGSPCGSGGTPSPSALALVPVFVSILKDSEAEVRTAAAGKISGVCKLLNKETVINDILPIVKTLSTDEASPVRAALASDVMGLAPFFGKEGTTKHLLDLFLQLLKDDTPEVRLNLIGKLSQVTQVLGLDQLSQYLLPAIVELAEDRQWRVRAAILEYIPLLAEQLGVDFFNDKLSLLCMSWLNDCVFSIREAATGNLTKIAKVFGIAWTKQHIFPRVHEQLKHRNYLYRETTLTMITALTEVIPVSDVQKELVPLIYILASDAISNVRINSAKTFLALLPTLEPTFIQKEVIPFLEKMVGDKDKDVVFFTNVALQCAKKRL